MSFSLNRFSFLQGRSSLFSEKKHSPSLSLLLLLPILTCSFQKTTLTATIQPAPTLTLRIFAKCMRIYHVYFRVIYECRSNDFLHQSFHSLTKKSYVILIGLIILEKFCANSASPLFLPLFNVICLFEHLVRVRSSAQKSLRASVSLVLPPTQIPHQTVMYGTLFQYNISTLFKRDFTLQLLESS